MQNADLENPNLMQNINLPDGNFPKDAMSEYLEIVYANMWKPNIYFVSLTGQLLNNKMPKWEF